MSAKTLTVGGGLALRAELAEPLGVNRQRAAELSNLPGFPEPAIHTISGKPLWRCNDVKKWNAARLGSDRDRKGGRPKSPA